MILVGLLLLSRKEQLFVEPMSIWHQKYLKVKDIMKKLIVGHLVFYYMNYYINILHLEQILIIWYIKI